MKALFVVIFVIIATAAQAAVPNVVNYQGRLTTTGGSPLDTTVSMQFKIMDAANLGNVKWTETQPAVIVQDGLFDVLLGSVAPLPDSIFQDSARWLEIKVGSDSPMTPREKFSTTAYSHRVSTVDGASGGLITGDVNISGKLRAGQFSTNSGLYANALGYNNAATGNYAFVAGGTSNTASGVVTSILGGFSNEATQSYSSVITGYNNTASGEYSTICGGSVNEVSGEHGFIGGGQSNTASGYHASVAGGSGCLANGNYSAVAGGYNSHAGGASSAVCGGQDNYASGNYSFVGGGESNTATGNYTVVSGGYDCTANSNATIAGGFENDANFDFAVVSGGTENSASATYSNIAGGNGNSITGSYSTVGGGLGNSVSGIGSCIPGGRDLHCSGRGSVVCGNHTTLTGDSSFLFSDGTYSGIVGAAGPRRFVAIASGGAVIYTSSNVSTGVTVAAGGGSWSSASDSTKKENIQAVNTQEILDKVSNLKISEWNYKTQDDRIRHMGPMAQDFYSTFGLGESDTTITQIDPDGVLFAAVQELRKQNRELENKNQQLENDVSELKSLVNQLIQLGQK